MTTEPKDVRGGDEARHGRSAPKSHRRTPMTGKHDELVARDREVLNELRACHDSEHPMTWARPLDCGGHNGSDHSYRLARLVKMGLAESRQRSGWTGSRGSKEYRITEKGREALRAGASQ